ncbi:MAG: hypothetical protein ABI625_06930 [bacterium]
MSAVERSRRHILQFGGPAMTESIDASLRAPEHGSAGMLVEGNRQSTAKWRRGRA